MFTRSMFTTKDLVKQHELLNEVADLVDSGKVVTTVTRQLSPINLENIVKAHTMIEKRDMIGKLVITQITH
jgi:NADPH:quinone reductase-like Zn-dependent oxidoreductase